MPIYEYQCEKCGDFEITQKIKDKALGRCPSCKGKVKKLISNTSFQLKGTGWYITDYARKDKDKSPKEKKEKKEEKTPATEAKADGKAVSDAGEKKAAKTTSSESAHP